jgi:acetyl-CoA synthetase
VFGVTINEFYGQTECNLVLGNCSTSFEPKTGSMGKGIPGHSVVILSPDAEHNVVMEPGVVGDIAVRSDPACPHPVAMLKYWDNPSATQEKYVTSASDGHRYLVTGDLGSQDEDGYFFFNGRDDDVISSAGYRIGPSEIENCLLGHPAVSNAAVIGVPDTTRGELVKAIIVPAPEYAAVALQGGGEGGSSRSCPEYDALVTSIQDQIKTKLARYEYPRLMEFVEELPMTTTGKIIRKELRDREKQKYI